MDARQFWQDATNLKPQAPFPHEPEGNSDLYEHAPETGRSECGRGAGHYQSALSKMALYWVSKNGMWPISPLLLMLDRDGGYRVLLPHVFLSSVKASLL